MQDVIHLLPDSVANQIAAGEVVQRPSSVIKELMENAVDAGATSVDVWVVEAGKTSIRVIDNGVGMSETDARLAFERHSTSKIKEAQDLFKLHTMGFRGEALASIAAVAQVELRTRRKEEEVGTLISLEGSKVLSQEAVSTPVGSNFLVRNLFFNIPARRKFLKSNQTELSNILQEFERVVLVHPEISFRFYSEDTLMYNLPAVPLKRRIMEIFGKKMNEQLLPVEVDTSLVSIAGYVVKPEAARKKGARQYFFVNNRYMKHPYFNHAVMDAYERLIPENEKISYFIYMTVDPSTIDVNIHPTKTEIKFDNEQMIYQILAATVKETLGKFNVMPTLDFDTEGKPDIPAYNPEAGEAPTVQFDSSYNPFDSGSAPSYLPSSSSHRSKERQEEELPSRLRNQSADGWENLYEGDMTIDGGIAQSEEDFPLFEGKNESVRSSAALHYQYKDRYIVTTVKSGLMLIDQRRAHIRILYDDYIARFAQHTHASQRLLFPDRIDLPASESVLLEDIMETLTDIGFDLSSLGGGSYAVNGVPAGLEQCKAGELLRSILDSAKEKGKDIKSEVQEVIALSLAKAAAIPSEKRMTNEEMDKLVDELFTRPTPNYTPDGKLILSIIPQEDITKLFN